MTFQASRCSTIVAESITFGEMLKNPIKSKAQLFDGRRDGIFYTQKNLFVPFQCLKVRVNNRVGNAPAGFARGNRFATHRKSRSSSRAKANPKGGRSLRARAEAAREAAILRRSNRCPI
jgi:hypothetical protein